MAERTGASDRKKRQHNYGWCSRASGHLILPPYPVCCYRVYGPRATFPARRADDDPASTKFLSNLRQRSAEKVRATAIESPTEFTHINKIALVAAAR